MPPVCKQISSVKEANLTKLQGCIADKITKFDSQLRGVPAAFHRRRGSSFRLTFINTLLPRDAVIFAVIAGAAPKGVVFAVEKDGVDRT